MATFSVTLIIRTITDKTKVRQLRGDMSISPCCVNIKGGEFMHLFYDFEVFKYDWLVVLACPETKQEFVIVNDREELEKL